MRQAKVTETAKTAPARAQGQPARAQVRRLSAVPGGLGEYDAQRRVLGSCSIITRGEVKGWREWIDETFLDQVVQAGNAAVSGVKARFTHPGMADGLGTFLGRWHRFHLSGRHVRADLRFSPATALSPIHTKDPAEYLTALAEDDPAALGVSIVYVPDVAAEQTFLLQYADAGGGFKSPDPENTKNLPHARLKELWAADLVDQPAANAGGLFSAGSSDFVSRAETLQAATPGLSFTRAFRTCVDRDPEGYLAWRRRGAQKGRRRGTR